MRYVITGGTGLIGRALSASLAGDGHEVTILSRNPSQHVAGLRSGITVAAWDPARPALWSDRLSGCDAVFNLAGAGIAEGRWTPSRKALIRSSRVQAGQALVSAIERLADRPRCLVQATGVGYYGTRQQGALAEASPAGDDFLASVCCDWEASTVGVEALGLRRVVTRLGVVLSTAGGALPKMVLPFRLFVGGPLGHGRQPFPWIHIRDVVGAMRFLIDSPEASGVYNLVAPEAVDNAAFSRALGQALHRPSFLPAPAPALRLALGEMAMMLLEGQQVSPARLLAAGYPFRFSTASAALRDLLA